MTFCPRTSYKSPRRHWGCKSDGYVWGVFPGSRCHHLEDDGSFGMKPLALKNGGKGLAGFLFGNICTSWNESLARLDTKGRNFGVSMVVFQWYPTGILSCIFYSSPGLFWKGLGLNFDWKNDGEMISEASTVILFGAPARLKHQQRVSQTCSNWVPFLSHYTHLKLGRICLDKLYTVYN